MKLIDTSVANEESSSIVKGRNRTVKNVQNGVSTNLGDIGTSTSSSSAHIDKDAGKLLTFQPSEIGQFSF